MPRLAARVPDFRPRLGSAGRVQIKPFRPGGFHASVRERFRGEPEYHGGIYPRGRPKPGLVSARQDAEFLPKLKPELIKKRAKGEAATDESPTEVRQAPSGPQLGRRPKARPSSKAGGPNPFIVIGIALVAGVALAKWLDWRGHAHQKW